MKSMLIVIKYMFSNPKNFIRLLSRLPYIIRGIQFSQNWVSPEKSTKLSVGKEEDGNANKLKQIFDNNTTGRGIWKWGHYLEVYNRYLNKFIGKEMSMVEIGVFSGGSLGMWQKYFGEHCFIHGVDIEEACKVYEGDKVAIHIGDQADRNFWKKFKQENERADVIIDDGGHHWEQQIVTLEELLPWLKEGGVYICEDIHGDFNRFRAFCEGLTFTIDASAIRDIPHNNGLISETNAFQKDIYSIHSFGFLLVIEKNKYKNHEFIAEKHGTEWQPFLK